MNEAKKVKGQNMDGGGVRRRLGVKFPQQRRRGSHLCRKRPRESYYIKGTRLKRRRRGRRKTRQRTGSYLRGICQGT